MIKGLTKLRSKKGISPVIATVLLIVIAVALFIAIFFWIKSMQKDVILKFDSGIEQSCIKISFDATVQGGTLQIENRGDVALGAVKVYLKSGGSLTLKEDWSINDPIMKSEAAQTSVSCNAPDQLKLVPVLIGISKKTGSEAQYVCEDKARFVNC